MAKHYLIIKNNDNKICYIKYKELDGMTFKPLNKLDCEDSVVVAKMVLFKPEFIEKVLKRKIKNKLDQYLKLILSTVDEDSETSDPVNVRAALNDITRYRQLVINNYRKYLEERYLELLLTKISIIEEELKNKLVYLLYKPEEKEEEKVEEIEHKRSR